LGSTEIGDFPNTANFALWPHKRKSAYDGNNTFRGWKIYDAIALQLGDQAAIS
jgi:hypothetical protein